jgi:hypothetical protein
VLEQSDHWENEPYDGDVAARNERFAERCDDGKWSETAGDSRSEAGHRDDQQRIQPQDKSDYDDCYADE